MCLTELISIAILAAEREPAIRAVLLNEYPFELQYNQAKANDLDLYLVSNENEALQSVLSFITSRHNVEEIYGPVRFHNGYYLASSACPSPAYYLKLSSSVHLYLRIITTEQALALWEVQYFGSCLLDKDQLFLAEKQQKQRPAEKISEAAFLDLCCYFWRSANYVAKSLFHADILSSLEFLNLDARQSFYILLRWYLECCSKVYSPYRISQLYLQKYLPSEWQKQLMDTYVCDDVEKIWEALYLLSDLFRKLAFEIMDHYEFRYDFDADLYSMEFWQALRKASKEKSLDQ